MDSLTVRPVTSPTDEETFFQLPLKLYADDPVWVAPLDQDMRRVFDKKQNSFFEKGALERYLAFQNGRCVGRIAAMVNLEKDFISKPHLGGFGFFECIRDQAVANRLFDVAVQWLQSRGLDGMRGPINFGETDRWWGLLVKNFQETPSYGMFYHPPYYADLVESYGMEVHHNQLSYRVPLDQTPSDRLVRISKRLDNNPRISFRMIDRRHLTRDAEYIRQIYNAAWQQLDIEDFFDSFTPLEQDTVQQMLRELKPIMLPEGIWLSFVDNDPAAFIVTIPDINQILRYFQGKISLWGIPKFLWYKRKVHSLRVVAFGTKKPYRRMGLEAGIFVRGMRQLKSKYPRMDEAIGAWTGEENWLMQRSIEGANGQIYQVHRTYSYRFDQNNDI